MSCTDKASYSYVCSLQRQLPAPYTLPDNSPPAAAPSPYTNPTSFPTESPDSRFLPVLLSRAARAAVWAGGAHGLFVGGNFLRAGASPYTNHIAQWMGGEFSPLGFGLDGAVHALAVTLPYVYAGGSFSRAFTPRRSALQSGSFAKWNTLTREWSSALLCKPSSPSPFSGTVNALATHAGKVLVGGRFGQICGTAVGNIAAVSGDGSFSAIGAGVSGGYILAIASTGYEIFVGGTFTTAGSTSASAIARWDGITWQPLGLGVTGGSVQAIVAQGLSIFVAGDFDAVDGGRVAARGVALFFGGRWYSLRDGLNGPGHALAVVQNCVVVGGSFTMAGNITAPAVARFCGGNPDGAWETLSVQIPDAITQSESPSVRVVAAAF